MILSLCERPPDPSPVVVAISNDVPGSEEEDNDVTFKNDDVDDIVVPFILEVLYPLDGVVPIVNGTIRDDDVDETAEEVENVVEVGVKLTDNITVELMVEFITIPEEVLDKFVLPMILPVGVVEDKG